MEWWWSRDWSCDYYRYPLNDGCRRCHLCERRKNNSAENYVMDQIREKNSIREINDVIDKRVTRLS